MKAESMALRKVKEGDDCSLGTTNPFTPKS
jgi:hypothetical protein